MLRYRNRTRARNGGGVSLFRQFMAIFSTGTNGFIYDPSDMASLNQLSTGLTPVTAVTQPVGLILDKHSSDGRGVVNLLTYTEQFDNAAWTSTGGSITPNTVVAPDGTLTADTFTETSAVSAKINNNPISTAASQVFTISGYFKYGTRQYIQVSGGLYTNGFGAVVDLIAGTITATGAVGTGVYISSSITAAANGFYKVTATGHCGATVNAGYLQPMCTDVSTYTAGLPAITPSTKTFHLWGAQLELGSTATAYQVNTNSVGGPGNHALQATAAARPTWTNRVNLLTYTEQFDNAAWTKNNATITPNAVTAPDGNLTADTLVESAISAYHYVNQTKTDWTISTTYTFSIYAKYAGRRYIRLNPYDGVTPFGAVFDIQNGVLGSYVIGGVSRSIESVGNGWYRLSITCTTGVTVAAGYVAVTLQDADNALAYTGDGVSGAHIWGSQCELAPVATTYQRVTTATDFDTAGSPYYLSFLGTDDSLSSATGGGGSAGFFWCGAVLPTGGAGTLQTLFADNGTNTGYKVQLDAANKLSFSAGNNTAFTTKVSTATVNVGTKYMLTVWDDGTNLNVQIGEAAAETVARPVVVAGTAGYTIAKDNGAASSFYIGNKYPGVYAKDTGLTASQRATVQTWVKQKAGL